MVTLEAIDWTFLDGRGERKGEERMGEERRVGERRGDREGGRGGRIG